MLRSEIIKLIKILSANYRNWPETGKEEDTVNLWEMMLEDMSFAAGQAAVKYHLSKSVYAPTIADIRQAASNVTQPRIMDAMEAWEIVTTAVRTYGYYREEQGMLSLPEDVRAMVKRFSWKEICTNDNPDTLRAQWRMAWETQAKRQKETNILPQGLLDMIENGGLIKRLE